MVDLIGKRFGKLLVIEKLERTPKHTYWKCKCDCGKETRTRSGNLLSGKSKSCGCGDKNRKRTLALRLKELNKKDPINVAENHVLNYYKKAARDRGLSFSLSKSDVIKLIHMPCYYCGSHPNNPIKVVRYDGNINILLGGIDRIDSSMGYEISNVVPCCKTCNYAKNNLSTNEFFRWIDRVYSLIHNVAVT